MSDLHLLSKRDWQDLDECSCECHREVDGEVPKVKIEHVGPCCEACARCGKRIIIGAMQMHLVECGKVQPIEDNLPDWVIDQEVDGISHVDTGQPPI